MDGGNGMPAGMLSSSMTAAGGFLGLDMSLQHHQHHHHHQHGQQQQQLLHHPPPPPPPPQQQHMMPFQTPPPSSDGDHQPQHPMRHASYVPPFGALRAKQQPAMSSEDDSGFGDVEVDVDARRGGGTPQGMPSLSQQSAPSPWQRMKWTDSMVRLLISVVYHVGDDVGGADGEQQPQPPHGPASKGKKPSASALLQKKGKWKSVSRAMMEKGFYVSPQQCEDKFNDLNKRYKRVNDLLGKGTACRVVENQALLETMDHLPPKAKEEARKLLNSKHLFFREMCAYHNAGLASCNSSQPAAPQAPQPPHAEQQQCLHHPAGQMEAVGIKGTGGGGGGGMLEDEGIVAEDDDEDDDVDSEDDDEFDEDDDEDDDELDDHNHHHHHNKGHHHQRQRPHQNKHGDGEDDEDSKLGLGGGPAKRPRRTPSQQQLSSSASPPLSLSLSSPNFTSMQQLKSELVNMAGGGEQQQRQWLRKRASELEEQRVGYQSKAFQLERQRFKWLRFSTNKEREMERMKLDNDRLRLENDRMLLLLRQKEIELIAGNRSGGGEQLHYSAAHSGRPAPDDQPSGTATA